MEETPVAVGTVLRQYLDRLGIHEPLPARSADRAQAAEADDESAEVSDEILVLAAT